MTAENLIPFNNEVGTPPVLLNGDLIPFLLSEWIWVYGKKGEVKRKYLDLVDGKLKPTQLAIKEGISLKKSFFNRIFLGWSVTVQVGSGGKTSLFASYQMGENDTIHRAKAVEFWQCRQEILKIHKTF